MNIRKYLAGALSVCLLSGALPGYQAEASENETVRFYVSTDGSDSAAGSASDPASLERAQELVRAASDTAEGDIEVLISGGTYYLDETLEFTRGDSGKNGHSIIWKAAESIVRQ